MNDLKLLGLRVEDRITGFVGIVESICYDLYGCIQAAVRPKLNEKSEIQEGRWFDVSRLAVLNETPIMEVPGGRFDVERKQEKPRPSLVAGPADKPRR